MLIASPLLRDRLLLSKVVKSMKRKDFFCRLYEKILTIYLTMATSPMVVTVHLLLMFLSNRCVLVRELVVPRELRVL